MTAETVVEEGLACACWAMKEEGTRGLLSNMYWAVLSQSSISNVRSDHLIIMPVDLLIRLLKFPVGLLLLCPHTHGHLHPHTNSHLHPDTQHHPPSLTSHQLSYHSPFLRRPNFFKCIHHTNLRKDPSLTSLTTAKN